MVIYVYNNDLLTLIQPKCSYNCHFKECVCAHIQDLFNKFQSLILPEAINNILTEDEGVLEMIDTVVNFTLSSYPGMGIQDALSALNAGLTEYANKVRVWPCADIGGGGGGNSVCCGVFLHVHACGVCIYSVKVILESALHV